MTLNPQQFGDDDPRVMHEFPPEEVARQRAHYVEPRPVELDYGHLLMTGEMRAWGSDPHAPVLDEHRGSPADADAAINDWNDLVSGVKAKTKSRRVAR